MIEDEYEMTNKETAIHIRKWVTESHGVFAWATDACGYNQSVRLAQYRNEYWNGGTTEEFTQFLLDYADKIEKEPDTLCHCIHPNEKVTMHCYACVEPSCKFAGKDMEKTRGCGADLVVK